MRRKSRHIWKWGGSVKNIWRQWIRSESFRKQCTNTISGQRWSNKHLAIRLGSYWSSRRIMQWRSRTCCLINQNEIITENWYPRNRNSATTTGCICFQFCWILTPWWTLPILIPKVGPLNSINICCMWTEPERKLFICRWETIARSRCQTTKRCILEASTTSISAIKAKVISTQTIAELNRILVNTRNKFTWLKGEYILSMKQITCLFGDKKKKKKNLNKDKKEK